MSHGGNDKHDPSIQTYIPVAATLKAHRGKGGGGIGPEETLVSLALQRGGRLDPEYETFVAAPLTSGGHPNSNMPGRRKEDDVNLVAGPLVGGNDGIGRRSEDDPNLIASTLRSHPRPGSNDDGSSTGVRRLTPTECERLQGLPDGWTAHGPDSRRYSGLGDAVTASVGEWLGRRIADAL